MAAVCPSHNQNLKHSTTRIAERATTPGSSEFPLSQTLTPPR